MNVIPAVDLLDGACVQLTGGDLAAEKVRRPDPVAEALRWWEAGAEWLHVVDLDRALGRGSNLRIVQRILEATPAKVVVGGGIRMYDDVDELLDAGAARVVVGTRAVTEEDFLRTAAQRYGNRLVVAVDARGDEIVVKGWTERSGRDLLSFGRLAGSLGVGALLYTDVAREGRMGGPNVDGVRRLVSASRAPVVASGGVASMDDLQRLAHAGAWGAVVGMAAYTGKVDMADAIRRFA